MNIPSDGSHDHAATQGRDKHGGHGIAMFCDRFWISLALTVPTLIWGDMLESAPGLHAPHFPGSQWIPPLFGAVTFIYGGRLFLQGAVRDMREDRPRSCGSIARAEVSKD